MQVGAGLFEGCALGVRAREFLDKCDVALRDSTENSGELKVHASIIRSPCQPAANAFGLKPSRNCAVPEGLRGFIARFPSVETLGFLIPSREAGLGCGEFGLD